MSYIKGATLKSLREGMNLTQKHLAEKLQVSDKAISKWKTDFAAALKPPRRPLCFNGQKPFVKGIFT